MATIIFVASVIVGVVIGRLVQAFSAEYTRPRFEASPRRRKDVATFDVSMMTGGCRCPQCGWSGPESCTRIARDHSFLCPECGTRVGHL